MAELSIGHGPPGPGGGEGGNITLERVQAAMLEELGNSRLDALPLEDGRFSAGEIGSRPAPPVRDAARLNPWNNVTFNDLDPAIAELDTIEDGQLYRKRRAATVADHGNHATGRGGHSGRGDRNTSSRGGISSSGESRSQDMPPIESHDDRSVNRLGRVGMSDLTFRPYGKGKDSNEISIRASNAVNLLMNSDSRGAAPEYYVKRGKSHGGSTLDKRAALQNPRGRSSPKHGSLRGDSSRNLARGTPRGSAIPKEEPLSHDKLFIGLTERGNRGDRGGRGVRSGRGGRGQRVERGGGTPNPFSFPLVTPDHFMDQMTQVPASSRVESAGSSKKGAPLASVAVGAPETQNTTTAAPIDTKLSNLKGLGGSRYAVPAETSSVIPSSSATGQTNATADGIHKTMEINPAGHSQIPARRFLGGLAASRWADPDASSTKTQTATPVVSLIVITEHAKIKVKKDNVEIHSGTASARILLDDRTAEHFLVLEIKSGTEIVLKERISSKSTFNLMLSTIYLQPDVTQISPVTWSLVFPLPHEAATFHGAWKSHPHHESYKVEPELTKVNLAQSVQVDQPDQVATTDLSLEESVKDARPEELLIEFSDSEPEVDIEEKPKDNVVATEYALQTMGDLWEGLVDDATVNFTSELLNRAFPEGFLRACMSLGKIDYVIGAEVPLKLFKAGKILITAICTFSETYKILPIAVAHVWIEKLTEKILDKAIANELQNLKQKRAIGWESGSGRTSPASGNSIPPSLHKKSTLHRTGLSQDLADLHIDTKEASLPENVEQQDRIAFKAELETRLNKIPSIQERLAKLGGLNDSLHAPHNEARKGPALEARGKLLDKYATEARKALNAAGASGKVSSPSTVRVVSMTNRKPGSVTPHRHRRNKTAVHL